MNVIRKVQKKGLFLRFMMSYILILSIPLLATLLIYKQSADIVKKDALEANLHMLDQSKYIVEKGLKEVDALYVRLSLYSGLRELFYKTKPIEGKEIVELNEIYKRLPTYGELDDFIKKFYIIFNEMKIVLNMDGVYSLSDFYGWTYKYGDMDAAEWENLFLSQSHNMDILPTANTYLYTETCPTITFLQSLPPDSFKKPLGTLMILINEDEVRKPLSSFEISGEGNVYILNNQGEIITSKNQDIRHEIPRDIFTGVSRGYSERKINGRSLLYSYITSPVHEWTFVAVMPSSAVLTKVNYIRNITFTVLVLCLLIGVVMAYFMAYRNLKPIKEFVRILSTRLTGIQEETFDEYNYLHSAISSLIDNDITLHRRLEESIPLAQTVFLQRLIKGELNSNEEIHSNMQQTGLELSGTRCNILLSRIGGYYGLLSKEALHELNVIKEFLKNIDMGSPTRVYATNIDEATIAYIIIYLHENEELCVQELERAIKELDTSLRSKYGIQITFAAGNFYQNISDIYYSFSEAKYVLEYGRAEFEGGISWYGNIDHKEWGYYYPIELEQRLINLAKAANRDEIGKILETIYKENFHDSHISNDMVKNLYNEMTGTLYKITNQLSMLDNMQACSMYDMLKKIKYNNTLQEAYEAIGNAYMYICNMLEEKKRSHNVELKEDIIKFLGENYFRQEMCLSYVASVFKLSEYYLSNFFKEQVGENFTDYVEGLRINAAADLIVKSSLSIEDIALKVGYNSSHVFRRAFKRSRGVIPTELRKSYCENP